MLQHEQDQTAKDANSTDEERLIDQAWHYKTMSDYIVNSFTALENLSEPRLSMTNAENNRIYYLVQVYSSDP